MVYKNRFGSPSWGKSNKHVQEVCPYLSYNAKSKEYVEKHDVCNIASMHMRLTDLEDQIKAKKQHKGINVEGYMEFASSRQSISLDG